MMQSNREFTGEANRRSVVGLALVATPLRREVTAWTRGPALQVPLNSYG